MTPEQAISTPPAATPESASWVALDRLDNHECAVVRLVSAGDDEMGRLMAMGVCSGRSIELVQRGDPLIVRVLGSRVGVSARLAARVLVERCGTQRCSTC